MIGGGLAIAAGCAVAFGGMLISTPPATREVTPPKPTSVGQEWAVRNSRGKAFAARGDPERALAEFNQAITYNPGYAVLYANRGGAKLQLGDRGGTIQDCSRAIEMDGRCVEGYLNRAQARKELEDWSGAAVDYARALEILQSSDALWGPVVTRLEEARRRARNGRGY
jgi:tetratricopeptide (TPR) repeat protein